MTMEPIDWTGYRQITFFTGAGMSAESGIPTYRGKGGVWHQYDWEAYACQAAFDRDPEKVRAFHELRRKAILACAPNPGHRVIAALERRHPQVHVVTQNIDGMHQRAGSRRVIELHGSIWRVRCSSHGTFEDFGAAYARPACPQCGQRLRPDIVWFEDPLDPQVIRQALEAISRCDLFVGIGTSGTVWPAAGFPAAARENGARLLEINPEASAMSGMYDESIRLPAGKALPALFPI